MDGWDTPVGLKAAVEAAAKLAGLVKQLRGMFGRKRLRHDPEVKAIYATMIGIAEMAMETSTANQKLIARLIDETKSSNERLQWCEECVIKMVGILEKKSARIFELEAMVQRKPKPRYRKRQG